MLVAVYHNNQDIRLEERPVPKIGEGEILVKVMASGICGTDVMEWYRIKKAPRILGHEIAGEIVESKSKKYKVRQRVFVSHHVPCNKCKYCLSGNHTACDTLHNGNYDPGGYAEFIRVPKENVDIGTYILPNSVSYEGGTMIEPLACVVRTLRLINVKKGSIVLVLGSGVSGLLNIALTKLIGATVFVTDIDEYRLQKAKEFGADKVFNVSNTEIGLDIKADRVIICTCAYSAVQQAFGCVDKKGIILFFAIPNKNVEIPITDFWRNEITISASYGAAPIDLEEALRLITEKKININDIITHRISLNEVQKGFEIVSQAKQSLKVVLYPHG